MTLPPTLNATRTLVTALTMIGAGMSAAFVLATPVNYDESIDGDLIDSSSLTIFSFDIGINTISGTTGFPSEDADWDSFAFILPFGTELASAKVEMFGTQTSARWQFYEGGLTHGSGTPVETINVSSGSSYLFSALPKGPGDYYLAMNSVSGTQTIIDDYTFTFEVVPEPSSLALLGLGGLLLARRRRG